jgi:hypothetical protein
MPPCMLKSGGGTRKFYWMTEGRQYEITFDQFARLFEFGRNDANRIKIHFASHLDSSRMKFMYPGSKRGGTGTTLDLLPFYACLNHLFYRMMTTREGDSSNISYYNRNLLRQWLIVPMDLSFLCLILFMGRSRQYRRALSRVVYIHPTLCIWLRGWWVRPLGMISNITYYGLIMI